jgi:hypothetical protein
MTLIKMVQPGMGRQQEERKELDGNQNGRIARRDNRLGIFLHHPTWNGRTLGEEMFLWKYRSKFPGFRKY